MIVTPHFSVGHIGKTGGDAAKQIFTAVFELGLEKNYRIDTIFGSIKHRPFSGDEKMRVLGIRQLPSYILSIAQHQVCLGGTECWSNEFCAQFKNGDNELDRMTEKSKYNVHRWLRCEFLRQDIHDLLVDVYTTAYNDRMKRVVHTCPTKAVMTYDHDVRKFFTDDQIRALYLNNPKWAAIEKKEYGSLVLE